MTVLDPVTMQTVASSQPPRPALLAEVVRTHGDAIREALTERRTVGWDDEIVEVGPERVAVSGALVWDFAREHAAVVMASWSANRALHEPFDPIEATTSTLIAFVLDRDQRCVLADPRAAVIGHDLDLLVGTHTTITSHPGDWALSEPLRRTVLEGKAGVAEYVMRKIGPAGVWYNQHVVFRRLHGRVDGYMETIRSLGNTRERIDTSQFDDREIHVLADYFGGLGIVGIARRHNLSVKTVRNILSSIYATLGVGSGTDMVRAFDPPPRVLELEFGFRVMPSDPKA